MRKNFVFDLKLEKIFDIQDWLLSNNMSKYTLQDAEFFNNNSLIPIKIPQLRYNQIINSITPNKTINNTWDFNISIKDLEFNELPTDYIDIEWKNVRRHRNDLLNNSDWSQLPDVPVNIREQYASYRQALRDITQQTNPFELLWPKKPE